jgi:hypothetical protein
LGKLDAAVRQAHEDATLRAVGAARGGAHRIEQRFVISV